MNIRYLVSTIFIVFFSTNSCNLKNKKVPFGKNEEVTEINLPDSIMVDSVFGGYIEYDSSWDSLKGMDLEKKYTFLYITLSQTRLNSFKNLKKVDHDTFVQIENNIIPIYDLKFKKRGKMILQGFIVDQYFLKHNSDFKRIITEELKITHPIVVY